MAIKKCFVTEEVVATTDGTTTTTTDPAPATSPAVRPAKVVEHVSLGKIVKAVENDLYTEDGAGASIMHHNWGNHRVSVNRPSGISDPLRAEARKYFVRNRQDQLVYLNSSLDDSHNYSWSPQNPTGQSHAMSAAGASSPISISIMPGTTSETQGTTDLFKSYTSRMQVNSDLFINNTADYENANFSQSELETMWTKFIDGGYSGTPTDPTIVRPTPLIDTTQTFTDHYTNITAPFSTRELELYVNNVQNPAYANIEAKYNFYEKGYENALKARWAEVDLPNLYSIITKDDNLIQTTLASLGVGSQYVKNVQSLEGTSGITTWENYINHFQNIGFPSSQINSLKKGGDHDDVHPMNNTLELKTEKTGEFLNAAELSGMTDNILKYAMSETLEWAAGSPKALQWSEISQFVVSTEKMVVTHEQSDRTALVETTTSEFTTDINTEDLFLIDLEPWLDAYFDPSTTYQFSNTFDTESIFLGIPAAQATTPNECNAFRDALQAIILSGKIQQLVNDRFRTFEEMLEGKEAYNETVIYEIVKSSTQAELQRIFIPNTSELDILHYIDTQVKYDKEYTYDIYAHQLIVGTQYNYTNYYDTSQQGITSRYMEFNVNYGPSLKIARLPIYKQNTKILDAAPVWPNVSLIPYKGVSNKFLINLSSNVGDYDMQPIIINDQDATFAENFRMARQLFPDDPINFKSDDPVKRFEIYRMDTPPTAYTDFIGHLLTIEESTTATAVSYVDNILPNQKYYYMFRATDVHNNRSNPTDVYQVEIQEFDGMIFFYTSIYIFEDPVDKNNNVNTSRSFRRYLKINPNLVQSLVNESETFAQTGGTTSAYNANKVILGKAGETVWSSDVSPKKFKIRVTSKNSGKKFDLNLTCKVKYNQTTQPT